MVNILDRFLHEHGVSYELALKVQRSALAALTDRERNQPESSVELLKLISIPLYTELHYEMNMPILLTHPFFVCYREQNPGGMRKICHTAITRIKVAPEDILFNEGEKPGDYAQGPRMFVVMSGSLEYFRRSDPQKAVVEINNKHWISEAVLWTGDWHHRGTLRATSDCVIMALSAEGFQSCTGDTTITTAATDYAELYVDTLNTMEKSKLSDVGVCTMDLDRNLETVFPEEWSDYRDRYITVPAEWAIRRKTVTEVMKKRTSVRKSDNEPEGQPTDS